MEEDKKVKYQKPEVTQHENLDEVTKGETSLPN